MRTIFFVSLPTQENVLETTQTLNTTNIGFAFSFWKKSFPWRKRLKNLAERKIKLNLCFSNLLVGI